MQQNQKLTKREERRVMRELMDRRVRRTPFHRDPSWVAAYWRAIGT